MADIPPQNPAYCLVESTSNNQSTEINILSAILAALTGGGGGAENVNVISSVLPTGASTSALQITGNNTLSSIDSKIVHVDTGNVTVVSTVLPTGASTSALQIAGNASLASIDSHTIHVDTNNTVITSSVLPTGAATEATLSSLNGKVVHVDTGNVTISTALPAGANTIGNIGSIVSALPAGTNSIGQVTANAGTNLNTSALNLETTQSAFSAKFPAAAAMSDAFANPTNSNIASFLMGYNGTTWDRLRSTTANGLQVDVTRITGTITATISGTVAVTQSTSPWVTSFSAPQHVILDSGTLTSITNALPTGANTIGAVTQASGPWTFNLTQVLGAALSVTNPVLTQISDGTGFIGSTTFQSVRSLNTSSFQQTKTSTNNSSTANLASSAVFTGTSDSTTGFGTIQVAFFADQPVTIQVQQSEDGTNWDITDSYTLNASTGDGRSFQTTASFTRVKVQNTGAGSTTVLRLQTTLISCSAPFPRALTASGNFKVAIQEAIGISVTNFPTTVDTNYGTVGASTLRSAAQIGNATGAAAFGAGTTTAQVLRVVIPTDQTAYPVKMQDGSGNNLTSTLISGKQALDVNVADGTFQIDTGTADKSTFTYGTSIQQPIGGVFQDTSPTLTAGQSGAVRLTQFRAFHTNLRDSSGNELLGQKTMANSVPVAIASDQSAIPVSHSDTSPATQNVTIQDTASTTTAGFNSQSIITGTATTNSTASFSLSAIDCIRVQVSGTWTGTLALELSPDGGTTWYTNGGHQTGTSYNIGSATANFSAIANVAGATNFRIRATAAMTGTAVVKVVETVNPNLAFIANPIKLSDGTTPTITATIKAASTAAVATDPALVVAISPNNAVSPQTATTDGATGVTVSTSAVLIKASNASRKAIVITNNGTGNLYIGGANTVTTSGATMGLIVAPFGTYQDSGFGLYTGDLYGIYSAVSASQNISVSERT